MSSGDETRRITDVYREYRQDSPLAEKWSGRNPGNRRIVQERDRARQVLFSRYGYVPLTERRILEIGCGGGKILAGMLADGARPENLAGVDLVAERIEEARHRFPDLRFLQGNAAALDFADASFDLVLLYTVFSSMLDARMQADAARETVRVLKPGGAVVWYDFRFSNPRTRYARGLRRRRIRALFPDLEPHLQSITLLPPLARRLGPLTGFLYPCLAALPPLRTHWLGLLIKPGVQRETNQVT